MWLFDKWNSFGGPRRWLYRKLIARADALTTLARDNADLCRRYLGRDAEFVYYGLNTQDFPITEPRQWQPNRPLRIAAIGNDRDRDWRTFLAAFGGDDATCGSRAPRAARVACAEREDRLGVGPRSSTSCTRGPT